MADGGAPFSPPLHEDGVHPPLPSRDELSRPQLINNPSATTVFESLPRLLSATTDSLGGFSMSLKPLSLYQGKPSVLFKRSEKATFLHKLKFVLVGKFSHGRPPISSIKSFFAGLKLQGGYNISIFDSKHLFIEVDLRIDYEITRSV
ncbi:hypothetical protein LIER_43310 [Lithospermum erythrorhizon]|uniref:Uncharacterized protein n=1 Tax=Lithospermum erythrorhizon TaxID=34254 RepID=A0AAV3PVS8_LITER